MVKVELELPESLRDDPRGCWADTERLDDGGACKSRDTDDLGLCPFHRAKLFGEPLTRQPDTTG